MESYDLVVIGGGPGGYVAAIRAAQLGRRVACVEREAIGGVCLNWGCIPSKSLIRNAEVLETVRHAEDYGIMVGEVTADYSQAVARSRVNVRRLTRGIAGLFKKYGVTYIEGEATLNGSHSIFIREVEIRASNIVIATGARPKPLAGFEVNGKTIVTYREAIVQPDIPSNVVIIGGGAIGVEFGFIYNSYGAKVTIVENEPRILPTEDTEISQALKQALTKQGIDVLTDATIQEVGRSADGVLVQVNMPGHETELKVDRILVSTGIVGNTENLGLEAIGIELDGGFIKVDEELRANEDSIYAIGDVTGKMPLAHVAQAHGVYVAEHMAGAKPERIDYTAAPRAIYSNPQVASIGLSEREAVEQGRQVGIGRFPFVGNGKALALGKQEGFAKVVIDKATGELLGAHLIGHEVTELLGELSLTRLLEGTNLEVGRVMNAHPTLSEVVKEAALAADGRAIHI